MTEGVESRGWGSLRPPSARDIRGHGNTKGLSAAPASMRFLVVLDFEWTADNKRPMLPVSEITQFPSVLVKLDGRATQIVDEFDSYVRPTLNPKLTPFSIQLTAISQADVDAALPIQHVLPRYLSWLRGHGLISESGERIGSWSFCTWTDADIGTQLAAELRHKRLTVPPCFDQWVDLRMLYQRRYKGGPRGGLQRCVEYLGLRFEGRAHNGLVDSQNTAKIVVHMARGDGMFGPAHTFSRPTRGLDRNGYAYGSKASRAASTAAVAGGDLALPRSEVDRPGPPAPNFDAECLPDEVLLQLALPQAVTEKQDCGREGEALEQVRKRSRDS